MKKIFLLIVCIGCCLGLCSCGIDNPSVIRLESTDDNGLYYSISDSNQNEFYYFDEITGKSQNISEAYFPESQAENIEKYSDIYSDILGSVGNTIYVRTDANELLSVNTETGEVCVLYEGSLLSDNNLINVYEDGIIVIAEATVYWSDLEKVDFKNIVNLQGYSQSWFGIDRIDNMIYFVVEYEDADQVQTGIASLDLSSKEVSLYHTFTGWKNRSLHVSDIMIGENGFYYVNAVHSKMAGGGLYYSDVQDDKYIRIAN